MATRAPDRGRDIQAYVFAIDPLMPTRRQRVIVQCKHWQSRSVNVEEVSKVLLQTKLWEPPMVEVIIIATSGRISADAVAFIERREEARTLPRIVMLADSQIETMLSQHQGLIAEFGLR
jgi:Restriction endonuclease